VEPPELRYTDPDQERRTLDRPEMRLLEPAQEGQMPRIVGYAARFNVVSEVLWGFREQIRPGAFTKTIAEADVRALWNHDPAMVLGRTKNGTLRLAEDEVGLRYEIDPPDTNWGHDAVESIRRRDVDQSSFSFDTIREEWSTYDNMPLRTVIEARLHDVSPVTFPAYPQTSAEVRAKAETIARDGNPAPGQEAHPGGDEEERVQVHLDLKRRQLQLVEM
jgi:HK97 family phage prohead protease